MKLAQIQVAPVERKSVSAEIGLFGQIDYDPAHMTNITAFMPGVIDRVYVRRAGQFVRWGDPLFPGTPALDAAAALRGALLDTPPGLAARWFGYNCDAVHFFPLDGATDRGIVCVNHEYTNEELFLPGASPEYRDHGDEPAEFVGRYPQLVPLTQAM